MNGPVRFSRHIRSYPGQRVVQIGMRTAHIGAAAMTLGAIAFGGESGVWHAILILSGLVIIADDAYRYGSPYFRYLQSWVIVTKVALLLVAAVWSGFLLAAIWLNLVIGSIISHAPAKIRHYCLWGDSEAS